MFDGKFRSLLSEEFHGLGIHDTILLESPFIETSRNGKYLFSVRLALTPDEVMIALNGAPPFLNNIILQYLYPLELVQINIFKHSRRQSLKLTTESGKIRYFELAAMEKRKIFWELWCYHTARLRDSAKFNPNIRQAYYKTTGGKKNNFKWRDKYLYLGSKREIEDKARPIPVPGLGPPEDIKLLYLKQKYFGCYEQSEHWVQCGSESAGFY